MRLRDWRCDLLVARVDVLPVYILGFAFPYVTVVPLDVTVLNSVELFSCGKNMSVYAAASWYSYCQLTGLKLCQKARAVLADFVYL